VSIYAIPGQTNVESVVQGFPTGLTGTVGFRIRDNAGSDFLARRTTGITEDVAGSGVYRTTFTAPAAGGQYEVWWDKGSLSPSNIATEDLVVSATLPTFSISTALDYITQAELKATLTLSGTSFADADLSEAITAASRIIDDMTGQRFYADVDASQVRYYSADPSYMRIDPLRYYGSDGATVMKIDPLITLTSLQTDPGDDGTFEYTWTQGTDFVLEPRNAPADGKPWTSVRRLTYGTYSWPAFTEGVKITGQFGWPVIPANVRAATSIVAARIVKRMREAPWGVIGFDAIGAVVRMSQYDPDLQRLLRPYTRITLFV
jgi:hypothetical protein